MTMCDVSIRNNRSAETAVSIDRRFEYRRWNQLVTDRWPRAQDISRSDIERTCRDPSYLLVNSSRRGSFDIQRHRKEKYAKLWVDGGARLIMSAISYYFFFFRLLLPLPFLAFTIWCRKKKRRERGEEEEEERSSGKSYDVAARKRSINRG
jgi:hypothetical protein